MNRKRNEKAKVRKPRQNSDNRDSTLDVPRLNPRIKFTKTFRFIANADEPGVVVTSNQIFGFGPLYAVSTIAAYPIAIAFKLNSIRIQGSPGAIGKASSVGITWQNQGGHGVQTEVADTSFNVSRGAFVYSRPPRDSFTSLWNTSTNGDVFASLVYPAGSVIDINVTYLIGDGTSINLLVGGVFTTGVIYYAGINANAKPANLASG